MLARPGPLEMTSLQEPSLSDATPPRKPILKSGVFRFSAVELLIALGLLFVTAPLVEDLPNGDLIELIPLSLVMISAVLAVGGRRRDFIIALALFLPALAARWLNYLSPDIVSPAAFAAFGVVFFGYVVAQLIHFILRAPRVDTNVLCAGVSGFLMLGLAWMPLYMLISQLNPAAFSLPPAQGTTLDGFNAFYFSFVSLCTVGYGDITPVSRGAKMVAVLEAITGLFYMAMLISRLVSVYSSNPSDTGSKPTDKS